MSTPIPTIPPRALAAADAFAHEQNAPPAPLQSALKSDLLTRNAPGRLVSLLAKSLGASRPDWRTNRNAHTAYASSRVSYVEVRMTDEQTFDID